MVVIFGKMENKEVNELITDIRNYLNVVHQDDWYISNRITIIENIINKNKNGN